MLTISLAEGYKNFLFIEKFLLLIISLHFSEPTPNAIILLSDKKL